MLKFISVIYLCVLGCSAYAEEYIHLRNNNIAVEIPIISWKTLRDKKIVKQDLDHSCGAASMATILNEFYGRSVSELEILKMMKKENMGASFDDMAKVLSKIGFKGIGYAASFDQLSNLRIPVIVYTKHRKTDHFSVVRGINKETIWIADPSLGNRTYSKHQFLEMWETRDDSKLSGKILAIIPLDKNIKSQDDFFTRNPTRSTAVAVQLQMIKGYL